MNVQETLLFNKTKKEIEKMVFLCKNDYCEKEINDKFEIAKFEVLEEYGISYKGYMPCKDENGNLILVVKISDDEVEGADSKYCSVEILHPFPCSNEEYSELVEIVSSKISGLHVISIILFVLNIVFVIGILALCIIDIIALSSSIVTDLMLFSIATLVSMPLTSIALKYTKK